MTTACTLHKGQDYRSLYKFTPTIYPVPLQLDPYYNKTKHEQRESMQQLPYPTPKQQL